MGHTGVEAELILQLSVSIKKVCALSVCRESQKCHFIEVSGSMPGKRVSSKPHPCSKIICPQAKAATHPSPPRVGKFQAALRARAHPGWGRQGLEAAAPPGEPTLSWWTSGCLSCPCPRTEGCQIPVAPPSSSESNSAGWFQTNTNETQ